MSHRRVMAPLFLGLTLLACGCGGTKQVAVRGTVTFDGVPVDNGSISFLPEPGTESRKAAAAITDGKYEIPQDRGPSPGQFKVQITWARKTGKRAATADPGVVGEETTEAIPAKYNKATTLIREIKPGDNLLDFALTP